MISHNTADLYGGGLHFRGSFPTDSMYLITACTVTENIATRGGGIYCRGYTSPSTLNCRITNCVLWDNSAQEGGELLITSNSNARVNHSDFKGGEAAVEVELGSTLTWGDGNIDADPKFTSGPSGVYYLGQIAAGQPENSPCLDTGDPATETAGWNMKTTRTDEYPDTGIVDMGYHYPSPYCTDSDYDDYAIEGDICGDLDCDDSNPSVHPGMTEDCTNGIDEDCDGLIDDADSDCGGYFAPANAEASMHGGRSITTSGSLNALALLLVPVGVVALLRIWRRNQ